MTALRLTPPRPSRDLIDTAIERHGALRVLLRSAGALLRQRARPPDVNALTPHLRRDIGLPPDADAPRGPFRP